MQFPEVGCRVPEASAPPPGTVTSGAIAGRSFCSCWAARIKGHMGGKACGRTPSSSDPGSISSGNRPTSLAWARSSSNSFSASGVRPCIAHTSTSQNEQSKKTPSSPSIPSETLSGRWRRSSGPIDRSSRWPQPCWPANLGVVGRHGRSAPAHPEAGVQALRTMGMVRHHIPGRLPAPRSKPEWRRVPFASASGRRGGRASRRCQTYSD